MIFIALVIGTLCLGVAIRELVRSPGDPFATMRMPVAGLWAIAWLTYGVNLPGFPPPALATMGVLVITTVGALLMCPLATPVTPWTPVSPAVRALQLVLLAAAVAIIAWNLAFVIDLVRTHGLSAGLSQHRLDRGTKSGAWSLLGLEVIHAALTAGGALGYALWRTQRDRLGAAAALAGLVIAFLSTGRWDVVGYVVWLLAIRMFFSSRRGFGAIARQAVVYAVLGVYFVAQGQLFGKLEGTTALANSTAQERDEAAAVGLPTVVAGGVRTQAGDPAPVRRVTAVPCPRWVAGAATANQGFRDLGSVPRVLVLYFAGPMATLDRAMCEQRDAERVVLMYWPNKLARLVGLRPPERLFVVDPFLDIGIPFNNYTVIYQFLSEIGPRLGLVAWVAFGALVGWGSRRLLAQGSLGGIVAGTAPLAMAIRTPWTNTFFDGTLAIWLAIALLPVVLDRVAGRR